MNETLEATIEPTLPSEKCWFCSSPANSKSSKRLHLGKQQTAYHNVEGYSIPVGYTEYLEKEIAIPRCRFCQFSQDTLGTIGAILFAIFALGIGILLFVNLWTALGIWLGAYILYRGWLFIYHRLPESFRKRHVKYGKEYPPVHNLLVDQWFELTSDAKQKLGIKNTRRVE